MATREPQVYDTISKGGNFWRIIHIENGIITAKRLHGAGNGQRHKTGRPLKGTRRQIEARGYHFCDIPPVKVSYQEPKPRAQQEEPATEPETATERRGTGEKEQEPKEPPKTAESAAQKLAEAEEAEQLVEDSRKINFWFRAFRCKLTTGREYTVRVKEYMTVQDAIYRMAQGRFVEAEDGSWFSTELIESVRPVKG